MFLFKGLTVEQLEERYVKHSHIWSGKIFSTFFFVRKQQNNSARRNRFEKGSGMYKKRKRTNYSSYPKSRNRMRNERETTFSAMPQRESAPSLFLSKLFRFPDEKVMEKLHYDLVHDDTCEPNSPRKAVQDKQWIGRNNDVTGRASARCA